MLRELAKALRGHARFFDVPRPPQDRGVVMDGDQPAQFQPGHTYTIQRSFGGVWRIVRETP